MTKDNLEYRINEIEKIVQNLSNLLEATNKVVGLNAKNIELLNDRQEQIKTALNKCLEWIPEIKEREVSTLEEISEIHKNSIKLWQTIRDIQKSIGNKE